MLLTASLPSLLSLLSYRALDLLLSSALNYRGLSLP